LFRDSSSQSFVAQIERQLGVCFLRLWEHVSWRRASGGNLLPKLYYRGSLRTYENAADLTTRELVASPLELIILPLGSSITTGDGGQVNGCFVRVVHLQHRRLRESLAI